MKAKLKSAFYHLALLTFGIVSWRVAYVSAEAEEAAKTQSVFEVFPVSCISNISLTPATELWVPVNRKGKQVRADATLRQLQITYSNPCKDSHSAVERR